MNGTAATERVAISLPEARLEHGLSRSEFAALSGVSASTIRKAERGGRVDPAQLIRLGTTLIVLDVYRPPCFEDAAHVLLRVAGGRLS
jgi:DNA-binding XRE family transcriptional regulator